MTTPGRTVGKSEHHRRAERSRVAIWRSGALVLPAVALAAVPIHAMCRTFRSVMVVVAEGMCRWGGLCG